MHKLTNRKTRGYCYLFHCVIRIVCIYNLHTRTIRVSTVFKTDNSFAPLHQCYYYTWRMTTKVILVRCDYCLIVKTALLNRRNVHTHADTYILTYARRSHAMHACTHVAKIWWQRFKVMLMVKTCSLWYLDDAGFRARKNVKLTKRTSWTDQKTDSVIDSFNLFYPSCQYD